MARQKYDDLWRRKKQILFVDEDECARELVTFTLTSYEAVIAHNSTEGLRLARHRYFDPYILDDWLPDGTGIELCRSISPFRLLDNKHNHLSWS